MSRSTSESGDFSAHDKTDYTEGELIVKLRPGVSAAALRSMRREMGATVAATANQMGFQLWTLNGMTVEQAIARYGNNPQVAYIQPNYTLSASSIPNDTSFNNLWGLNNTGQTGGIADADIDAAEAWDITQGDGVVIGVIDSGIDYTHPDLNDNMWVNTGETPGDGLDNDGNGYVDDYYGYDFINGDSDPFDDNGHGTHVAGTIAAEGNNDQGIIGVAPQAKVMALKFLDADGFGDTFAAIQAIQYAVMMGADITNNSWGGGEFSQALYDAIAQAGQSGQLFIAAAGNDSNNNDAIPDFPGGYNLDNIISVAATTDDDLLAGFSNFGKLSVDVAAPGENIYSTLPNGLYGFLSGTSMATPHVAGLAALLLSQDSTLTPTEVKQRLLDAVDPLSDLTNTTVTGGRINALQSLLAPFTGRISGYKWHDSDADGVWDDTETVLKNWTVFLDTNTNGQLDNGELSTQTNDQGKYLFKFLNPGLYTVAEVVKPGWEKTYPSAWHSVTVNEGETTDDVNFGNTLVNPASISGTKWHDLDKDGIHDGNEPGLAGWTIYLDDNRNGVLDSGEQSTITDANGDYLFTGLAPDQYVVAEVAQPGWEQIYPLLGTIGELLNADFSDSSGAANLDGFTIDNTGGTTAGLWHLSTGRGNQPNHSADDSLYFGQGEGADGGGNYDVGFTAGRITSPVIDLTGVAGAELSFNYVLQAEVATFDKARILVSVDGGSFQAIASNATEIAGFTQGWTNATFDLSAYAGKSIQIQFDFNTQDGLFNNFEGWYIDDVVVKQVGNGTHLVDLDPGETATDIDFGNRQQGVEPTSVFGTPGHDDLMIVTSPVWVFGGRGNDVIDSSDSPGKNRLYGGAGHDTLMAGKGDRLLGGNGNDKLFAGKGNARLRGGAGADQFWLTSADLPSTPNTVMDFTDGSDVIGMGGLGIGFSDLTLVQTGDHTLIKALGSELAILNNTNANTLTANDFVFA